MTEVLHPIELGLFLQFLFN